MEIRQLKYFIQICNDKSFSKASKNLHISQQGLSKAIQNLEDELGTLLFVRSAHGIQETEFGALLLEKSQKAVNEFDLLVDFLYDKAKLSRGTVSLGLPHILYTNLLATIIYGFNETYPDIKLEIVELGSYMCEKKMEDNALDISFAVRPVNTKKFRFIPVTTCSMMLLVNKNNSLAQKNTVKFSDLKNESFIMLSSEYKSRQLTIEHCLLSGFSPHIVFETSQLDYIIALVASNKGIAVLPELNSLKAAKTNDKVSAISFYNEPLKIDMGFITNRSIGLNSATNTLVNYTLKCFKSREYA